MKEPRYRLLAADLDGTLADDEAHISPRVQEAVRRALECGVIVTLATGRSFPSTLPFAHQLGITAPLICYQGGLIQDPRTGEILYEATLPRPLVEEMVTLARQRQWHLILYERERILVTEERYDRAFYERWLGRDIIAVPDLMAALQREATKFIVVAEPAEADRIEEELRERFRGRMGIVRSHRFFVEGNPLGVNKGQALARLARHLEVPQAQVMAIGDQDNDADMVAWAGCGVAMGNASEAVKAAADWIAPPVEEDGAAVAIERFIL